MNETRHRLTRRGLLQRALVMAPSTLILPSVLLSDPRTAAGQEMLRRDRLALLYSNQVIFDRAGQPLVSVRVMEQREPITFSGPGRLTLLPGADSGSRVKSPPKARWTVRVEEAEAGEAQHWVVVERFPAGQMSAALGSRQIWADKGHEVRILESGALLGLAGRTLDTRAFNVVIDPQPTEGEAQALADRLMAQGPVVGEVMSESAPGKRPTGWIVAREARSGVEIRARDLLWITPEAGRTVDLKAVPTKRGPKDRSYEGDVYFAVGRGGLLSAVNLLRAERMLEGVVPSELYPAAPLEALKAQAIAARGQLLAKVGTRHRADPYLLCSETHCQVYGGHDQHHKRTTEAVQSTQGELLFDKTGLVDTVYCSSSGGHTEAFHNIWGGQPKAALMGILDAPGTHSPLPTEDVATWLKNPPKGAWDAATKAGTRVFRWEATRTGEQVTRAVNALANVGPVIDIKPLRRGVSGRVLAIEYIGAKGRHIVEGEYPNRLVLGRLRSGMWVMRREGAQGRQPSRYVFNGGGFGHGVGMSQHGAMGMAKQGKTYRDILAHYYVGSHIEKAW
ncbi:MAG: SpoIID/LytB domain-containing protein [Bradymonadia bacterium]